VAIANPFMCSFVRDYLDRIENLASIQGDKAGLSGGGGRSWLAARGSCHSSGFFLAPRASYQILKRLSKIRTPGRGEGEEGTGVWMNVN